MRRHRSVLIASRLAVRGNSYDQNIWYSARWDLCGAAYLATVFEAGQGKTVNPNPRKNVHVNSGEVRRRLPAVTPALLLQGVNGESIPEVRLS